MSETYDGTWPPNPSFLSFDPAGDIEMSLEYTQAHLRQWLITNSFRDTLELIHIFLDEIRKAAVVFSIGAGNSMTGDQWDREVIDKGTTFHRFGIRKKFEKLISEFNLNISPEHVSHSISLYTARNCLVHRNGIVAEIDTNDKDKLSISWTKMKLFYHDADGNVTELLEPTQFKKETKIMISNQIKVKSFEIGEKVEFSLEELTEIIYSNHLLVQNTITALQDFAIGNGYIPTPPQSS